MSKLEITRAPEDDGFARMTTPALAARLQARICAALRPALAGHPVLGAAPALGQLEGAVADFFALYPERPVRDNAGGSQFNDSLGIYLVARLLVPALIVESGVHRGHGTWLLRQACPAAQIHSFDIDLSRLVYRDRRAHYSAHDWCTGALPAVDPARALVFFDDHISQARRVAEAHGRGFRRLLFDDNFPAETLCATGGPPLPTIHMVLDPELAPDQEVAWRRKGKHYRTRLDGAEITRARALIAGTLVLPELGPITRQALGSGLTLVDLTA